MTTSQPTRLTSPGVQSGAVAASTLAAVMETLPYGICQFDSQHQLHMFNSQLQENLRLSDEQLLTGITFFELVELIPDLQLQDALMQAYQTRGGEQAKQRFANDDNTLEVACDNLPDEGYLITVDKVNTVDSGSAESCDPLTGLPDRRSLVTSLERHFEVALKDWQEVAVLYLDVDRFKPVNDTLGHQVGDKVLLEVAKRIGDELKHTDVLSRLGGDEFVVIQPADLQPAASQILAKNIIDSIASPMNIDGHSINVGLSVGIAVAPFDGQSAGEILRNADLAMYRAKQDGRNAFRFFEPEMAQRMQDRRDMELELASAIREEQFEVRYQPVMDVQKKRIVSVEALVRWRHPKLGLVSPADFIPLAEETGQITELGEWVLREACEQAATWNKEIAVAVNVSAVQLKDRSFVGVVSQALKDSGLPAHRLEIEVTETALISETDLTLAILTELRQVGVKIAMDDFGTGYSSINHLRQFPFDKIKIDRSFVTGADSNPESAALVKMIAALGTCLAVTTTAEGVETEKEFDVVRDAGCSQIQGYLLSKPITNTELAEVVQEVNNVTA